MNITIKRGDEEYGPYTLEEAREYMAQGRIAADDIASLDGATWRPLSEVVPELGGPASAPVAAPAAAPTTGTGYPPGDIFARFGAALIDLVVACLFVAPALLELDGPFESSATDRAITLAIYGAIAGVIYLLIKDGFGGRSVGKRVTGLIVVNLLTNRPCSIFRSAVRSLVFCFSNLIPIVGSLIEPILVIATPERRRLGDRAASTQVVPMAAYEARRG
ncbi:MAG TPA: RDD family protein [Gemmatimonadales bacterium]|nr:RDD family protein [Gemmatimonadales bacterium]